MLRVKLFPILILIFLVIGSCEKETPEFQDVPEFWNVNYDNPQLSGVYVTIDVSGRVLDQNHNGISNAIIEVGSKTAQTDENGIYTVENVQVDKQFALIQ